MHLYPRYLSNSYPKRYFQRVCHSYMHSHLEKECRPIQIGYNDNSSTILESGQEPVDEIFLSYIGIYLQ